MNIVKFKHEIEYNEEFSEIKEVMEKFKHSVIESMSELVMREDRYYRNMYKDNEFTDEYLVDPEYRWYTEVSAHYLIDISTHLSKDIKEPKEDYDSEFECFYQYYNISYVIEFFKELDEAEFFYGIVRFANIFGKTDKYFIGDLNRIVLRFVKYWDLRDLSKMIELKKSVFIAMSFSEDMKSAREEIKRAIEDFDYLPILIDEKEHSNFIVPEIINEIEKCEFLIADYTENKNGVYYEAGIGKGLKKIVIHTCKDTEKDREKLHFDIKDINTIFWKNTEELYERLIRRIECTIK